MSAKSHANAPAITAAARAMQRPQPQTDDEDILASLKSIGAITSEPETTKQTNASDSDVIASLKALGIIGDEKDGQ